MKFNKNWIIIFIFILVIILFNLYNSKKPITDGFTDGVKFTIQNIKIDDANVKTQFANKTNIKEKDTILLTTNNGVEDEKFRIVGYFTDTNNKKNLQPKPIYGINKLNNNKDDFLQKISGDGYAIWCIPTPTINNNIATEVPLTKSTTKLILLHFASTADHNYTITQYRDLVHTYQSKRPTLTPFGTLTVKAI